MILRKLIPGLMGLVVVSWWVPTAVQAAPQSAVPAGDSGKGGGAGAARNGQKAKDKVKAAAKPASKEAADKQPEKVAGVQEEKTPETGAGGQDEAPADDMAAAENAEAETAAVAKPVSADPVQVYGWREHVVIQGVEGKLKAKLDTGALTSSIHAEEQEMFERDGKKWVRFIVTDPTVAKPVRTRLEAPLVRVARIKEPGGESVARQVVRLSFQIGDRKLRGDFSLNNRHNMLAPVLIGRSLIKELGWVDASRTHLADQKLFR